MERDMTTGSPSKLILTFALPVFFGNVFQQLYSMIDSVIVGRFVGVDALAAVGSTGTIIFLILGFLAGMTTGFTVLTAQRYGSGDMEGMRKTVGSALILSLIVTVVITITSLVGMKSLLHLMNTPDNIFQDTYTYMMITCAGFATQVLYNLLASILRALGNSKVPLYFLMVSACLNVVLDLLFIIVFHMGVAGAAYATVISQGVSGILCFIYILKKIPVLKLKKEHFRLEIHCVKNQLGLGIPMALQFSITAIGTMMIQSALNTLGSRVIASYAAAAKIEIFLTQAFSAFGITMATFCAQNQGAGRIDRIRKGMRLSVIYCIIYGVVAGAGIILFGKYLVNFFIEGQPADIMAYTQTYFIICGTFYPILGIIFIFRNGLQGMGYGVIPMTGGVAELVARAVVAIIASGMGSYAGICMANPIAWVAANIPLITAYIIIMRKKDGSHRKRKRYGQSAKA